MPVRRYIKRNQFLFKVKIRSYALNFTPSVDRGGIGNAECFSKRLVPDFASVQELFSKLYF